MNDHFKYAICRVRINRGGRIIFSTVLTGKYLIFKDAAVESMVERLDDVYGNRSRLVNLLKDLLALNLSQSSHFFNMTDSVFDNYSFTLTYIKVNREEYEKYLNEPFMGDIHLP